MNIPLPRPNRCVVMGVLNVTPDSFSDGGRYADPERAIAHGLALTSDGADIVDVGGESTRPGAERVSAEIELERVSPVIRSLAQAGVVVSVDTMRATVAEAAIAAGAVLVNDVSGGLADPAMAKTVAAADVAYVAMHWRGPSAGMAREATYADVVADVRAEIRARMEAALDAGIRPDRLVLDPGIGFAKTAEHNWALLAHLDRLAELGHPLLVGVSRKSFLGRLLRDGDEDRGVAFRDDATTALTAVLAMRGIWAVRVHAVRASADAVRAVTAMRAAEDGGT
jgi:dihydropteroate synthase